MLMPKTKLVPIEKEREFIKLDIQMAALARRGFFR